MSATSICQAHRLDYSPLYIIIKYNHRNFLNLHITIIYKIIISLFYHKSQLIFQEVTRYTIMIVDHKSLSCSSSHVHPKTHPRDAAMPSQYHDPQNKINKTIKPVDKLPDIFPWKPLDQVLDEKLEMRVFV